MDLGNGVEINLGKLDFSLASDAELQAARETLEAVGAERGLWVPEGAGQIVVAQTVEIADERARLLGTVAEGAGLFNGAVQAINAGRRKKDQIPVTPAGEYRERAEDWLTESRIVAAAQLPATDSRPRLIIPRLNRPITTEEVVNSWKSAANGKLWSWKERMQFLNNWSADQLSGYDLEQADEDRLAVVPTAYDSDRTGTVAQQKAKLEVLQTQYPELDVATIFDGAVLARRYMDQRRNWQDSYVRGIALAPAKLGGCDCVPGADVYGYDDASVNDSVVGYDGAARLRVR